MAKKTNKAAAAAAAKEVDPTLPFTEVTIAGRLYKCAFDYESLAKAEMLLISRGHYDANLLYRLPHLTFDNVRVIFACSLLAYQPEIDFAEAKALVTAQNLFEIANKMMDAWKANMPEKEKEKGARPPEPEQ